MNRRRLMQGAVAAALLGRHGAWAQAPGRTLSVAPAQASPALVSAGGGLLVAPRRALVIGNSRYSMGPLRNPANDATAIAEELRRQGFEVSLGLDLKRDEMAGLIGAYGDSLAGGKPVALFYFAGHGIQLAWRNYLVPVDAAMKSAADVRAQCIDVNSLLAAIGKAANPMNVIILDACRDDPYGASQQKGLSQVDAPPGTLLAYATSPGHIASDGEGSNGLYTEHLLREMKVPEAKIEDVFKRVRLAVRRRSNGLQIPWESTSLEQDFWFIPPRDLVRLAHAEVERARREREQARREELERARREEEEARRRLEALRREHEAAAEREFRAELALWEKADGANAAALLEDYLRRYPSGRFAELAQVQLDLLLRREGEKPIQIASQAGNPFTLGTARADLDFKVGDSYTYAYYDRDTRELLRRSTQRLTEITDTELRFNDGRLVLDRLGNLVSQGDGRRYTPRQDYPLEYAAGRRWASRFTATNEQRGGGADSEWIFRITGREKITVAAGTFDCFVIVGEGYSYTRQGLRVEFSAKRWVAPDQVRRPILTEQFRKVQGSTGGGMTRGKMPGTIFNNERMELVAFTQA
jgi:hypothetical protein